MRIPRVHTDDRLINQIQQNFAASIEPLFSDEIRGSFVYSLTGFANSPTRVAYWEQGSSEGPVTISVVGITGTSNATSMTLTGLPKNLWPVQNQACFARIINSGTVAMGLAVIQDFGIITFYSDVTGSAFTNSGVKGLYGFNMTYVRGI